MKLITLNFLRGTGTLKSKTTLKIFLIFLSISVDDSKIDKFFPFRAQPFPKRLNIQENKEEVMKIVSLEKNG